MKLFQTPIRVLGILLVLCACAAAQQEISVQPPTGGWSFVTGNYRAGSVPAIRLQNSSRFASLRRAGNLYLSPRGGALRSGGLGVGPGPRSVSLQGVSVNTSGGVGLSAGNGVGSGGGITTQLGPNIPLLDPTLLGIASFGHSTFPQSNLVLTNTAVLVDSTRFFEAQYAQNFEFGLAAQLTYMSTRVNLNSPFYSVNPATSGDLDLILTQNLLQGFGRAVNGRNIRVQKNNVKVSALQFKLQIIATVSAALNLYWDLVSFDADVRARQREVGTAQQLLDDN